MQLSRVLAGRPWLGGLLVALVFATPAAARKKEPKALSIGTPTTGRLERGIRLRSVDAALDLRCASGAVWGLPQLVRMLRRGARRVGKRYPGSILLVGDLSRRGGGALAGHRSHASGRDADVGFYFVDDRGKSAPTRAFHRVRWNGSAQDAPRLHFDDARNWALVQSWVTDPGARVQHIFVAAPLRARLLKFASRNNVYLPVRHRAAIAMKQPSRGLPHDDHFHVRIRCPSNQRDVCVSEPSGRPRRPRHRHGSSAGMAAARAASRGA